MIVLPINSKFFWCTPVVLIKDSTKLFETPFSAIGTPKGTLGSVVSLLAATLYQGNPDRNHKLWNIVSSERDISYHLRDSYSGLLKKNEKKLARSFNFTFRYIDDVLSLNYSRFGDFVVLCCVGALPKKDKIDPWCLVSGLFALKVGPFVVIIKKYLNEHNKYCVYI
jgi:hypothetical protein